MDAFFEALVGAILEPLAHLAGELLPPLLELLGEALMTLLSGLFELFGEWILSFLLQVLVVPVACILSTPFVLIDACFGTGSYFEKVVVGYGDLCRKVWWWN